MAFKYSPPKWTGCIPQGSHGSSIIQKKYWKVVSDFVRIRDFYDYGICISCPRKFLSWEESQAGHYKAWASCRGYSKWFVDNCFGQCSICNSSGSSSFVSTKDVNVIGGNFKDNIRKRYGAKRIKFIESLDSYPTEKLEDYEIVDKIKKVILDMSTLKAKPDYYEKIINHKEW